MGKSKQKEDIVCGVHITKGKFGIPIIEGREELLCIYDRVMAGDESIERDQIARDAYRPGYRKR